MGSGLRKKDSEDVFDALLGPGQSLLQVSSGVMAHISKSLGTHKDA